MRKLCHWWSFFYILSEFDDDYWAEKDKDSPYKEIDIRGRAKKYESEQYDKERICYLNDWCCRCA